MLLLSKQKRRSKMKIKFYSDREIMAAMPKRGGKYKGVLANLMMERSMSFRRHISYYINADIDKIMRRLS